MSTQIILALFAAFAVAVVAKPSDLRDPTVLDIAAVMNKTVCPMDVDVDEDPDRIPRRIKVIKCKRDPNEWCAKMHIPKNECCQHQHDDVKLECVEIQDWVQVYYPARDEKQSHRVSVGCTCVMERAGAVGEPTPAR